MSNTDKDATPKADKPKAVTRGEFEKLAQTVEGFRDGQDKILDILSSLKDNKQPEAAISNPKQIGDPDTVMPMQYQSIFEKHFDANDGFVGRLSFPEIDEKGRETGGIMFTIVVPQKFSNMEDAQMKYYKVDLRSKALQPNAIAKGIDDWCKLVSQNLRYNKNLKTK